MASSEDGGAPDTCHSCGAHCQRKAPASDRAAPAPQARDGQPGVELDVSALLWARAPGREPRAPHGASAHTEAYDPERRAGAGAAAAPRRAGRPGLEHSGFWSGVRLGDTFFEQEARRWRPRRPARSDRGCCRLRRQHRGTGAGPQLSPQLAAGLGLEGSGLHGGGARGTVRLPAPPRPPPPSSFLRARLLTWRPHSPLNVERTSPSSTFEAVMHRARIYTGRSCSCPSVALGSEAPLPQSPVFSR